MRPWLPALAGLIAVLLLNAFTTPGFFMVSSQDGHLFGSLVDILNRSAPTLLVAIGMTLVIATGGVDLSVGAVMAVSGAVAANLVVGTWGVGPSWPLPMIVAASVLAALACGAVNALLVGWAKVQPIVATLVMMVAARGVAQLLNNGQIVTFHHDGLSSLARSFLLGLPNPFWIAITVLACVAVLTKATSLGLFIQATGDNPSAAHKAGLNVPWIKAVSYLVVAGAAGIAGTIVTGDINGADANNAGLYMELDAILAVSVGGTALTGGRFTLLGTVLGTLFMQTITNTILVRGVAPEVTLIVKALAVVVVCLLQSQQFKERFVTRKGVAA